MRSGGVKFGRYAGDRKRHYRRYFRGAKTGEFCKLPDKLRWYSTGQCEGRLHCRQRQIPIGLGHDAFLLWHIQEGKPLPDDNHTDATFPGTSCGKKNAPQAPPVSYSYPRNIRAGKAQRVIGTDQSDGSFYLPERRFIR